MTDSDRHATQRKEPCNLPCDVHVREQARHAGDMDMRGRNGTESCTVDRSCTTHRRCLDIEIHVIMIDRCIARCDCTWKRHRVPLPPGGSRHTQSVTIRTTQAFAYAADTRTLLSAWTLTHSLFFRMVHSTRATAGGGVNRLFATRTDALNAQYAIAGGAAEPHTRARGSPQDWCCFNATHFLLLLHQCHTRFPQ
jgi:hypothetical protein